VRLAQHIQVDLLQNIPSNMILRAASKQCKFRIDLKRCRCWVIDTEGLPAPDLVFLLQVRLTQATYIDMDGITREDILSAKYSAVLDFSRSFLRLLDRSFRLADASDAMLAPSCSHPSYQSIRFHSSFHLEWTNRAKSELELEVTAREADERLLTKRVRSDASAFLLSAIAESF